MLKSVLIFGGSRGIGKMLAEHFALKDRLVSVAARNSKHLKSLKAEIQRAGGNLNTIKADIGDEKQVLDAFKQHKMSFGKAPLVVINTAAILRPIGPLWELSSTRWNASIRSNLLGSFLVTKIAIQTMIPKGVGSIIHFSGGGAAYARPAFSAYGSAKTGILRLVETVSEELQAAGHQGIIINAIAPGAVKTDMTDEIGRHGKAGKEEKKAAEKIIQTGGTPPKQIISLVEFLCNDEENSGISGRLIHVRDNYRGFVKKYKGNLPQEAGKLRRMALV